MRLVALLARFGIAAGLTAYLLWRSSPAAVLAALSDVLWVPIGLAVLLVLADRALMAYRWIHLLCIVEPSRRPPVSAVLRVFFVSSFLGTFLPASVGGDAVRAYSLRNLSVQGSDAIASVVVDRVTGLASVLLMALLGLLLARDLSTNVAVIAAIAASAAVCALFFGLIASRRAGAGLSGVLLRLPGRLGELGQRVVDSLQRYARFTPQLVNVLFCSVAVQVLRIVQAYFLGQGLGIAAPLEAYFAFIPLILIVMLLPVTINGIGTSQAGFVWLFARAGVGAPQAFALSVLFVALGIVGNLPGGVLLALGEGRDVSSAGAPRS